MLALIGFAAALWQWRRVIQPLQSISEIAERGAQGDHHLNVKANGSPGVQRLCAARKRLFAYEQNADSLAQTPQAGE